MAAVSYHISNLLEKMTSIDKDYRFMAANDLMAELQKDSIKLDDDSERKVVRMILKLLEDKNGEVQNLAVKCLGPLVNKVKEFHIHNIVDSLCDHMLSDREQLRDMSSLALKTVINELPTNATNLVSTICKRVTDRLSEAIVKQVDVGVQLEALDILCDLLSRFGSLLLPYHPSVVSAVLPQLTSSRLAVRKRSIVALSLLVVSCSPATFNRLMEHLHTHLSESVGSIAKCSPQQASVVRTYIQCVAAIARQAGHRFGKELVVVMPELTVYVGAEDDELREHCICAFESFVLRCPQDVTPHVPQVRHLVTPHVPQVRHLVTPHIPQVRPLVTPHFPQVRPLVTPHVPQVRHLVTPHVPQVRHLVTPHIPQVRPLVTPHVPQVRPLVTPHVPQILEICLKLLTHDPNYNYDDYSEEDNGTMDLDEDEEEEEDDEYSDDDDMSWKVRRASAKCIEAIVSTRHEMLLQFYTTVSPQLIARFKEREENVKVDIFNAYTALLRQSRPSMARTGPGLTKTPAVIPSVTVPSPDAAMEQEEETVALLKKQVPLLVRALHRQLREKSSKTRQGCFALLTELILALPAALTNHIPALLPGLHFSLSDKSSSSNMKITALSFVHTLLQQHPGEVFQPHVAELLPPLIACAATEPFYKITAEALLVLQCVVRVVRPIGEPSSFDFTPYTLQLYQCTLARLKAADLDQEVKERAIACMGQIISHLGDHLQDELASCLPIFLERLKNEITRLTTVKALTTIASSPLRIDLRPILADALPVLSGFLRKNQRALKLSTLLLLDTLVQNYSQSLTTAMLSQVVMELPNLISESDLHVTQLTLSLLCTVTRQNTACLAPLSSHLLPSLLHLVRSPLLQGGCLRSLQDLFECLVRARIPGLSYQELLAHLLAPLHQAQQQTIHKQSYQCEYLTYLSHDQCEHLTYLSRYQCEHLTYLSRYQCEHLTYLSRYQCEHLTYLSRYQCEHLTYLSHDQCEHLTYPSHDQCMAACVASLALTERSEAINVVQRFLADISSPHTSPTLQAFSLLAIGEIGKHVDLSGLPDVLPAVLAALSSNCEEVKSSAAYSLGHLSCGNLTTFLPFVLHEIQNNPKRQYLLLHSLKEMISLQSQSVEGVKVLQGFVSHIWAQLFRHTECQEEGTRNVVAECLGKLTLIKPKELLPSLQQSLHSDSAMMRTTAVTAVKFTISDQPSSMDAHLRPCIGEFLSCIQDPDLNVRRVALVALNSAAHNKPSLVRDLLSQTLPQLYDQTKIKKELIHEVEMGPFKHPVDDGLDIRKAAFECMYTLLETCLDRLDIYVFLEHVESGLRDHYDIKMLTYLMLTRLAHLCPQAVLQKLERLVEPLRSTVTSKVKAHSVKQEYEKQDELKRSAMRAVAALLTIPDADKNLQLSEFVAHIRATPELETLYDSIQKDSGSGNSGAHEALMDLS
ncbi:TATA-binding protein interacting (TIP20) [Trinorchestia longiramus]|nr:TATA-binding protein interacting (TIP20) [Trinorchestia longiramus]